MIYILGVAHFKVQFPHKDNDLVEVDKYLSYLKKIIQEKKIQLVAEEISEDALCHWEINNTHARKIISTFRIEYLLCDPGFDERNKLGLQQREDIARNLGFSFPLTTEQEIEINKIAKESDIKREKFWLNKIKEKGDKTTLLICGYGHVDSIAELALKENVTAIKTTKQFGYR